MNVSLQDGHNIGWKLAQVLLHRAPASILSTYVPERRRVASDLITFDRRLTELFHASAHDHRAAKDYTEHFLKSAKYMAGLGYSYGESVLTASEAGNRRGEGNGEEGAAREIGVGRRLQSKEVLRWCDAKVVQLQSVLVADNRVSRVRLLGRHRSG
jgi:phenol 2-monooxygenase